MSSVDRLTRDVRIVSHFGRVICATCGRKNPENIVFCQECGQRLARGVAPMPQGGAARPAPSPLAATQLADTPPPFSPAPAAVRPPVPNFNFSPRDGAAAAFAALPAGIPQAAPTPVAPAPPPMAAIAPIAPSAKHQCARCSAWNDIGLRFCVACGSSLDQHPPAPAASPIAPARVVPVAGQSPREPEAIRVCTRCRGACNATSQFCRFCGASLADAAAFPGAAPPAHGTPLPATPNPTTDPIPPPPAMRSQGDAGESDAPIPLSQQRRPFHAPAQTAVPHVDATHAHGSPPVEPSPKARLVVIAKDGGEGPSYPIGEVLDVGRVEGNVTVPDDRYLSPRHARISRRERSLVLRDLGSTNGAYIRLRPGRGASASSESVPHVLRDQDLFLVGQQVLRFEVVNDAEEGLGPASEHGTLLFGSPAAPRYARLSQRTVEGVARDIFHVRKAETVVGRESGDIVFTEDPFLSRRHAAVRYEREARRCVLVDLGSSNGTFVQIHGEVVLQSGDQFRVGQQLFRVDVT